MPTGLTALTSKLTRADRRFWRVLLLIALVALAVRVSYVAFAKRNEKMMGDEIFYNAEANRLARGEGFLEPFNPRHNEPGQPLVGTGPAADHPPLTVIVLAPVSWATGESPIAQRITMSLLGVGLVVVIGVLARELAGDRAGWIAAGIAAVYPNLWVNDGLVMSETLAALTVALAMLYAYRLARAPTLRRALLVGLFCALAAMARTELVLLIPLLAVPAALVARPAAKAIRWRYAGAAVLVAAVVILPWVIYNMSRFKEPTYLSTNDGIALLGSNCDSVYHGGGMGLTDLKCLDAIPKRDLERVRTGDQSVDSKIYRERAFDYMSNHKTRVPLVMAARVGRTWSLFRPWDMVSYNEGEAKEGWVTALGIFTYFPLLVAAIAGCVVLYRRRRRLWPLLVPPLVMTIASAASYGQTRFRAPAEPSLVILAAITVAALLARDWPRRRAPISRG